MAECTPPPTRCPVCRIGVRPEITLFDDHKYRVILTAHPSKDFRATLMQSVQRFWRWCAEGKKPHGHNGQYFYDNYHNAITYDEKTNTYSYSIQVYDSPEGDTWTRGKFRISGGEIEILNSKAETR